ncbi:RNA polymerase sigma factor SigJ [Nocardia bovistercoris]|uniref:RNA polymerase sigma factor SigJ n=1 Tax=Nocardia bovistercoris TaxID=2785916 RepID=A0A931N646_9NOCA|nr:RNA polymerase sigma factor SigJ [Nocardia bovistercoris]MBH0780574.1 RNA polymerase sigma factor SigJ [Nocardia bovistercoris]
MVAALLAELFESHRAHLFSVAYRMTGSVGDAEDAIQESRLRLAGVHQSEIDDLRVWLSGVVGRICLDHLHSAALRRENYVGQWLPEPVVTGVRPGRAPDALDAVARDHGCHMAALVLLDTLTAPQRVAYVLRESLSMSFEEIGAALEISTSAAARCVAHADEVMDGLPAPAPDAEHEAAVRRLLAALATGELRTVVGALHPDAVLIGDANGTTSTAVNIVGGAEQVARFMLALVHRYGIGASDESATRFEFATVNGQLGLVINLDSELFEQDWHPARVVGFTARDGYVWGTYDHANPAKLTGVRP